MSKKLKCGAITAGTKSKMFTEGKVYEVMDDGMIIDDLGHQRFIGSEMSFIVENNYNIFQRGRGDLLRIPLFQTSAGIFRAYFEETS